jgi:DNA processing protein
MTETPPDASRDAPTPGETAAFLHVHLATLYDAGAGTRLIEMLGTPEAILARPRSLEVPGVTRGAIARLLDPGIRRHAEKEVEEARRRGIEIIAWGRPGYPAALRSLPGMPLVLYRTPPAGCADDVDDPLTIGIIGSRRPSPYGLRQARRFADALARRGITVVSGLALGVDGEAHRAALDAGGRTIAVLGSGLGRIYPPAHRDLARRIALPDRGALLSELPLDAAPKSFHFPMRNRVLSGLSSAILVVEAGEKSGSLITVRHALDQGKTVYVVPGRVDRPEAIGCLRLLQDGATPVIEPDDVLPGAATPTILPAAPARAAATARPRAGLGGPLGSRLDALFEEEDSWHPDTIAERLGAPPAEIISELARLELEGLLRRLPGGSYSLL